MSAPTETPDVATLADGLVGDVSKMWEDAKANDPQVRRALADPRLRHEQVAEMFFGVGVFAALRVFVSSKSDPEASP